MCLCVSECTVRVYVCVSMCVCVCLCVSVCLCMSMCGPSKLGNGRIDMRGSKRLSPSTKATLSPLPSVS